MKLTFAELIKHVRRLAKSGHSGRILTADRYLLTLGKCTGGLCPTDRARYQGPEWEKRVKEAGQIPVYHNSFMNFLSFNKSPDNSDVPAGAPKAIAGFEAVYTSIKQDRDSDVLHPEGAEVDEKMPLLWQHDPTAPIGAHRKLLEQDKSKVRGYAEIADTPLGKDAAYLAEFGALRISHGFRPKEFEPITEKSGRDEIITGFNVLKYEMMEVSLVSVPSNTDAVIEAFHRNKLGSALAKSWGKTLDERRQRFFTTGFGVKALKSKTSVVSIKRCAATGKKTPLVPRKDAAEFEKELAAACEKIIHSGDYGMCFYKAAGTAASGGGASQSATGDGATGSGAVEEFEVWWTAGDADDPDNTNEEGVPFTSPDQIKQTLMAVDGVKDVKIEAEGNPPFDEGWREVYPEIRDWVSDADGQKPQAAPAQNSEPPAGEGGSDANDGGGNGGRSVGSGGGSGGGKNGKKGAKADAPVTGSFEHIAGVLQESAAQYLASNGVTVPDGETVEIEATFPDCVIIGVGDADAEEDDQTYYRVTYSSGSDGTPAFTGNPEEVELQITVVGASGSKPDGSKPEPDGTDAASTGGGVGSGAPPVPSGGTGGNSTDGSDAGNGAGKGAGKKVAKWVPVKVKKRKGKVGKKDTGLLKEAMEHINEATKYDMHTVAKTCLKRASELITEVIKSDGTGTNAPADDVTDQTPGMDANERNLWVLVQKAIRDPRSSKTAVAALMSELAMILEKSDVLKLLDKLGTE